MLHGQDVLADFERASAREWLITDGLGGYAAGTESGAPARRSHALLAAASPYGQRTALVLRFEEQLAIGAVMHELSGAFFAGRPARPGAFASLESFTAAPCPCWRWRFDDLVLERSVQLIEGHPALIASWTLVEGADARLSVAPLMVARDPFGVLRENAEFRGAAQGIPGRVRLETLPGQPGVTLWHNGAFLPARSWAKGLAYPLDECDDERGERAPQAPAEDAFLPGWVQATLATPGESLHVVLSPEEGLFRALATEERLGTPPARTLHDCIAALERTARERRATWRRRSLAGADLTARQAAAAHGGAGAPNARRNEALIDEHDAVTTTLVDRLWDGFVRRHGRVSLVDPGPGGVERGADALRGAATLVTLRAFEPARAIARGYLEYLDEGLAPESFDPADGMPRYGDPEPSLWLVNLVDLIARRASPVATGGTDQFLRDTAWPALEGVLHHLRSGSRHGVRCDHDGLLWSGVESNARARAGTNALWYHALVAMAQLGKLLGRRENAAFYLAWAHELQRGYAERFWDEACGCLFDALAPDGPVRGVSPSQLWAVSLPPALLPQPLAQRLLATVDRELLGPSGLDAAPGDGTPRAEWLGAWMSATLRAHGREPQVIERVTSRLVRGALRPGAPRDARSALATAELLRVWLEDGEHAGRPGVTIAG